MPTFHAITLATPLYSKDVLDRISEHADQSEASGLDYKIVLADDVGIPGIKVITALVVYESGSDAIATSAAFTHMLDQLQSDSRGWEGFDFSAISFEYDGDLANPGTLENNLERITVTLADKISKDIKLSLN